MKQATSSFHAILAEALANPVFREELLTNPESTALRLGCTDDTTKRICSLTPKSFEAVIGQLLGNFLLPRKTGEQFLVVPDWLDIPTPVERKAIYMKQDLNGGVIGAGGVSITPGAAFGSGWHPTTELCIRALELYLQPGDSVLDLGTGSGILAVAAAKLDAGCVYAVDIDQHAVAIARNNGALNNLNTRMEYICGPWQAASGSPEFNIIAANMLTPILIEVLREGLGSLLSERGWIIASGIKVDELDRVEAVLLDSGLLPVKHGWKSGWAAVIARLRQV